MERHGVKKEEYEGKKIVSFAGKLANFKGVDILLAAVKLYEDRKPETITLIVGDGDEREKLHQQARDLKLKTVHFFGNVPQPELRCVYNIADVNLVPSRREPFGLVAIEAMACGAPVIATDQGGLPDFVNESVGGLVKPEDAEDLAAKIIEVLERQQKPEFKDWRQKIASYARNHYAQDRIIEELDALYRKALED
jgi:glycosyltransferase involved in cell wall biosynthesis